MRAITHTHAQMQARTHARTNAHFYNDSHCQIEENKIIILQTTPFEFICIDHGGGEIQPRVVPISCVAEMLLNLVTW